MKKVLSINNNNYLLKLYKAKERTDAKVEEYSKWLNSQPDIVLY